ncbi:c-type cytochrome [bacterium]|nr:c-type cytochrome [bacterium]
MNAPVLDHSADGIEELDNPLPRWWLYLFYGTIIFAIYYAIQYPSTPYYKGTLGWTQEKQWASQAPPKKADPAALDLKALATKPEVLEAGKKVFISTCASCHGTNAEGKIGPCLTDSVWKYGSEDKEILLSIRKGRPKGMPAWDTFLKPDQVGAVATYVHSIGNTTATPANATGSGTPIPTNSPNPEGK